MWRMEHEDQELQRDVIIDDEPFEEYIPFSNPAISNYLCLHKEQFKRLAREAKEKCEDANKF